MKKLAQSIKVGTEINFDKLKWLILFLTVLLGLGSIFFTYGVVDQLRTREHQKIELYAKTVEYFANKGNDPDLNFLFNDLIVSNKTIPVIMTDESGTPLDYKNISEADNIEDFEERTKLLKQHVIAIEKLREPMLITLRTPDEAILGYRYVYYKNSQLLVYLTYFPVLQVSVILIIGLIAYFVFSFSAHAEQNKVWVGLAKETAHQLGTPLSSIMAWIEYLKTFDSLRKEEVVEELNKDVMRLETIASRFSNIGSIPKMSEENIIAIIEDNLAYLNRRISKQVSISFEHSSEELMHRINKPLFEWVIENLVKNGVDAMSGIGKIKVHAFRPKQGEVIIDISDTGKGIAKSRFREVFKAGYTTKRRGWGLGLTLAKRIVDTYHGGRLWVKTSEINKGTTFRILLATPI